MNNLAQELFPMSGYTVQPCDAMDMRVNRISQDPQKAQANRIARKMREHTRTAQGRCIKCGETAVANKKVCYACVKRQQVYAARAILTKFGYNPDNHLELRLS